MSNASPTTTVAVTDAHGSALRRALRVTASEKWDLNRRFPVVLTRASGAHAWDINGRQYVDFTSCSGAAPLGAGYEPVVEHAAAEMRRTGGILPGPLSGHRIELAERLAEIFPVAERSMFFRTGSCATTAAVRLARSFTGLNHVLTSGYHGWHDWQLQDRPEMGLPNRDRDSVDFRYNLDLLDELASVQRVAAVIITPEVNFFPPEYHQELQRLVHRHGALLILDEVMTGFRYGIGGYHMAVGITPDLITLSKGLANGMALSAVAGRADVLAAAEKTYMGNTYQREVTPFAAALSTLHALRDGTLLARMREVGDQLIKGLNEVFARQQVAAWAFAWPTMFDVVFANAELGHAFFQEMWSRGFLMQYGGRFMPSAALSGADVQTAIEAAGEALPAALSRMENIGSDPDPVAAAVRFARDHFVATPGAVRRWFTAPGCG
ncbi:aminotransferase class III-fold pyridoxal phosphate-dependent enzyme [Bradyrhizobium elkanii]|uniref:aminotransferase class III-fold pyridoxal phosphate-dependent enzyme n=1 Tax=Bradyrhizobium elkanii TaxID=29448 RepID=UPI000A9E5598|nr:aminotransferase class III-fold pyridoxal phosphate-dependent enzyme [Bradyrhizobium elkanii]MCP1909265.1 glutamate-1-semialdehyde 2,1-aminomutase/neamine transaminase/2'-deamino-2'-hydroxyneamine transaminase/neomycin C transaminase [Bradyrhizobium elkanii]